MLWCPGKTKSQARGLGCCLTLLSTAFNMTEHNSDSDHIDRKRLTRSGEKSDMSVVSLWHILYDCHACNRVEVITWLKKYRKDFLKSHCWYFTGIVSTVSTHCHEWVVYRMKTFTTTRMMSYKMTVTADQSRNEV